MKNLFNTKSSFATALSRCGRVLSLLALWMMVSTGVYGTTFGIRGDGDYGLPTQEGPFAEMTFDGVKTYTYTFTAQKTTSTSADYAYVRFYKNNYNQDAYRVYGKGTDMPYAIGTSFDARIAYDATYTYGDIRFTGLTSGLSYTITLVYNSDSDVDLSFTSGAVCTKPSTPSFGTVNYPNCTAVTLPLQGIDAGTSNKLLLVRYDGFDATPTTPVTGVTYTEGSSALDGYIQATERTTGDCAITGLTASAKYTFVLYQYTSEHCYSLSASKNVSTAPYVTTAPQSAISSASANLGGTFVSQGYNAVVQSYGIEWTETTGGKTAGERESTTGTLVVGTAFTTPVTFTQSGTYKYKAFVKMDGSGCEYGYGDEESVEVTVPYTNSTPTVRVGAVPSVASAGATVGAYLALSGCEDGSAATVNGITAYYSTSAISESTKSSCSTVSFTSPFTTGANNTVLIPAAGLNTLVSTGTKTVHVKFTATNTTGESSLDDTDEICFDWTVWPTITCVVKSKGNDLKDAGKTTITDAEDLIQIDSQTAARSDTKQIASGSTVILTAHPSLSLVFLGWYDGAAGGTKLSGDNPYSYTVSEDKTVYAHFATPYTFDTNADHTTGRYTEFTSCNTLHATGTVLSYINNIPLPDGYTAQIKVSGGAYAEAQYYDMTGYSVTSADTVANYNYFVKDVTNIPLYSQYGYNVQMVLKKVVEESPVYYGSPKLLTKINTYLTPVTSTSAESRYDFGNVEENQTASFSFNFQENTTLACAGQIPQIEFTENTDNAFSLNGDITYTSPMTYIPIKFSPKKDGVHNATAVLKFNNGSGTYVNSGYVIYMTGTGTIPATFAATGQLNVGDGDWQGTVSSGSTAATGGQFGDNYREITLKTEYSGSAYSWVCDSNPYTSAALDWKSTQSSQTATVDVSLPGTYTFHLVLTPHASATAINSQTITVNVPYPSMGVFGAFVKGSTASDDCYAATEGEIKCLVKRGGLMERDEDATLPTWTKVFKASGTGNNATFNITQRYKHYSTSCDESSDNAGWLGYQEYGYDNRLNAWASDLPAQTLNLTGIKTPNFTQDLSLGTTAADSIPVKLTVVMNSYNNYDITLEKMYEVAFAVKSIGNDKYGQGDRVTVNGGSSIENHYVALAEAGDEFTLAAQPSTLENVPGTIFMGWSMIPDSTKWSTAGDMEFLTLTDSKYTVPSTYTSYKDTLYAHFATLVVEPVTDKTCTQLVGHGSLRSYAASQSYTVSDAGVKIGSTIYPFKSGDASVTSMTTRWNGTDNYSTAAITGLEAGTEYKVKAALTYNSTNYVSANTKTVTTGSAPAISGHSETTQYKPETYSTDNICTWEISSNPSSAGRLDAELGTSVVFKAPEGTYTIKATYEGCEGTKVITVSEDSEDCD